MKKRRYRAPGEESAGLRQSGKTGKRLEDAGIRRKDGAAGTEESERPWKPGGGLKARRGKGESVACPAEARGDALLYDEKGKVFEIQLEPERLGKLSITLSMEQEGLKAVIRTKDAKVQSLLASEISALAEKLSENGVQVKRMDVVCGETGSGLSGGQGNGSPDPRQNAGPPWERSFLKIQAAYDSSDSTQYYVSLYEEMLGSTVSYRV